MRFLFRRNPQQTKTVRRTPSTIRPRLEALEGRCLMSAGALDPTFGDGAGYVTASPTNNTDTGESTVIEPNGTLILAGDTITVSKSHKFTYAVGLTAYNPDGSLNTAFGNGGTVIGPPGKGTADSALYPSTDPNGNGGKFLVAGPFNGFGIARYNANGTLDSTFGQGGIATANFGNTLGTLGADFVIIQPNGKIVALGQSADNSTAELARFNANGSLDTTFGTNGLATVPVPNAMGLLLQPDSSLVVIGDPIVGTGLIMAGMNANGTLNTSFGSDGYVTNSLFGGDGGGNNGSLGVVDPTGKTTDDQIIVIGTNPNGGWELARYNPDGTLDTTFGNGGMVHTLSAGLGSNVTIQPDGKFVAVGDATYSSIAVARYNTDGSLDSTFGVGGIVMTQIGTRLRLMNEPAAISLQPNGDILVAGSTYTGSKWNFALVRYLPSEPEIGSFTANPNPVTSGSVATLTASNITDANPGSTITQVMFYYFDVNGNKVVLGTGTPDSSGDWSLTFTVNLAAGTYTLYAQAEDSYGVLGDPDALSLTVQ